MFDQTIVSSRDPYLPVGAASRGIESAHARHGSSSFPSVSTSAPGSTPGIGCFPQVQNAQGMNGRGQGNGESDASPYYRKHVLVYNNSRPAPPHGHIYVPSPTDASGTPTSSGSMTYSQSPVYSPSSLPPPIQSTPGPTAPVPQHPSLHTIQGIPSHSQSCLNSFSSIQNRPKTPHELLGLPPGAALNLWSLPDPENNSEKPKYNYHVLVKLAILGNKGEKATLQDILRAIRLRYAITHTKFNEAILIMMIGSRTIRIRANKRAPRLACVLRILLYLSRFTNMWLLTELHPSSSLPARCLRPRTQARH